MISTFSFGQLVTIYSIIILTWGYFDCHEFCENFDLLSQGKVVFQNDIYEYSHFYHYSQFIRSNQSSPRISGTFEKLLIEKEINLKFPFRFYDADLSPFIIDLSGRISLKGQEYLKEIFNYISGYDQCEVEILNEDDTIKAMYLIRSNGKIYFYYENIPSGIKERDVISGIAYNIWCGIGGLKGPSAEVSFEWIKSGTLVEYDVLGDCPNHNSSEACHGATSSTTCIWCEIADICITGNGKDVHVFEVNGCQIKNMTTDTTVDIGERKSSQYVYIVVPLVISFLIVCIGCGIWLWFHRRKRVYP
ncbi:unnamed protein product [Schistosoma margrebowiei]|uniref:Egg protein CP391S-like protein n=1 Tax=Schistosoma margrebowiei TaxID=48269 RepID=A0AA84Z4P1_9TREM|nr:unnamed protein product [Schistosoma margrebowiei]